jgi:hypothetical protein
MSAFGSVKQFVEQALTALHTKDDEQDAAIKELQDRVAALEAGAPAAKKTAPARSASASAGAGTAK